MSRGLIDANVFLYAIGAEHGYRDPCRAIVERLARGELAGEVSVEILQEIVHVRRRRGERDAGERVREIEAWGILVHAFDVGDLNTALALLDEQPDLHTRDAIHAATARNRGIELIVSADADFDRLPGLQRIDPGDARALERLA